MNVWYVIIVDGSYYYQQSVICVLRKAIVLQVGGEGSVMKDMLLKTDFDHG